MVGDTGLESAVSRRSLQRRGMTSCMSRGAGPNRQIAYLQTITSIRTPYDDFQTAPNVTKCAKRGQKCTPDVLNEYLTNHRIESTDNKITPYYRLATKCR